MQAHHEIPSVAAVMARAFDLVDEFRWRYDAIQLTFRETVAPGTPVHLGSLVLLGVDADGSYLMYATGDRWCGDVLVPARIDAGGLFYEDRSISRVLARASRVGLAGAMSAMWAELATPMFVAEYLRETRSDDTGGARG